eukprot:9167674-Ditylum_brightwellii.AAC.1
MLVYQKDHPGTWLVTSYFQVLHLFVPCLSPSGMCSCQKEDVEDAPDMNFAIFNTTTNEQALHSSEMNFAIFNTTNEHDQTTNSLENADISSN